MTLSVAACGSGSKAGTATSDSDADATAATTQAEADLAQYYEGTNEDPPTETAPVTQGAKIFAIGADMATSATSEAVQALERAGEIAGWDVTTWDGKAESNEQLAGIRAAVNQRAEAIFLYAIDCASVKGGLEEAKKANAIVVSAQSYDCSDVDPNADSLITHQVDYVMGGLPEFSREWGAAQAIYAIAKLGGRANVLNLAETDYRATVLQTEGYLDRLAECKPCAVVDTVEFTAGDLGPGLQQKIAQALQRNPEVNTTMVPYDAALTLGVLGGIRDAGMAGKVLVAGGEGQAEGIELLREGQVAAEFGIPTAWEGWAAADAINRLLAGEKPKPSGIGIQIIDEEHNLPDSGPFEASVDYEAIYTKAFEAASK